MLINIGFGNAVNSDKLLAVVSPLAAPVKRMVGNAREAGHLIDATQGRKTKSVLVLEGDRILLSALQPETVLRRFNEPAYGSSRPQDEPAEDEEDRDDSEG